MTDRDKVTMVIDDLLKYKTDKDRIKTIDWIIEFANRQKQVKNNEPLHNVVGRSEQLKCDELGNRCINSTTDVYCCCRICGEDLSTL